MEPSRQVIIACVVVADYDQNSDYVGKFAYCDGHFGTPELFSRRIMQTAIAKCVNKYEEYVSRIERYHTDEARSNDVLFIKVALKKVFFLSGKWYNKSKENRDAYSKECDVIATLAKPWTHTELAVHSGAHVVFIFKATLELATG